MSEEVEESSKKRKYLTWDERINGRNHTITPKIRRFILLFVSKGEGKTTADFAKYFKVNPGTIATWLSYPQVREEINRLLKDNEARVMSLLESLQDEIIKGLLKMFKNERLNPETRLDDPSVSQCTGDDEALAGEVRTLIEKHRHMAKYLFKDFRKLQRIATRLRDLTVAGLVDERLLIAVSQ